MISFTIKFPSLGGIWPYRPFLRCSHGHTNSGISLASLAYGNPTFPLRIVGSLNWFPFLSLYFTVTGAASVRSYIYTHFLRFLAKKFQRHWLASLLHTNLGISLASLAYGNPTFPLQNSWALIIRFPSLSWYFTVTGAASERS